MISKPERVIRARFLKIPNGLCALVARQACRDLVACRAFQDSRRPNLLKSSRPGFPAVFMKPGIPKSPPGGPTAPVTSRISTPSGVSIGVATASTTPESAKPSANSYPSTKFNKRVCQQLGKSDVSLEPPAAKRVLSLSRVDGHGAGNSSDVEGEGRSPHADIETEGSRGGDVADKQAKGIRKGEVSVEQAEGTQQGDSDEQAEGTRIMTSRLGLLRGSFVWLPTFKKRRTGWRMLRRSSKKPGRIWRRRKQRKPRERSSSLSNLSVDEPSRIPDLVYDFISTYFETQRHSAGFESTLLAGSQIWYVGVKKDKSYKWQKTILHPGDTM